MRRNSSLQCTGGLFDGSQEAELVFKFAIARMNKQRDQGSAQIRMCELTMRKIISRGIWHETIFLLWFLASKKIKYGNEFEASETVCKMIEVGLEIFYFTSNSKLRSSDNAGVVSRAIYCWAETAAKLQMMRSSTQHQRMRLTSIQPCPVAS